MAVSSTLCLVFVVGIVAAYDFPKGILDGIKNFSEILVNELGNLGRGRPLSFVEDDEDNKKQPPVDIPETVLEGDEDNKKQPPLDIPETLLAPQIPLQSPAYHHNKSSRHDGELLDKRNDQCECGRSKAKRIITGTKVSITEHPWMVAVVSPFHQLIGGGVLIDKKHVLTAAHVVSSTKKKIRIVVGTDQYMKGRSLPIQDVFTHPDYNKPSSGNNDIAIIRLQTPLKFSSTIKPICLPGSEVTVGTTDTVIGWGKTSEDGSLSDFLLKVDMPVLDPANCKKLFKNIFTDKMLCCGYLVGGKDACQGDSGGPLMRQKNDQWSIDGVVSFGIGCAKAQSPGVYTKVTQYLPWIKTTTDGTEIC